MKVFGLDVEMVGVEPGITRSAARVSLVANNLKCIYDKYVRQESRVTCYNTKISGITEEMLRNGKLFKNVRADVLSHLRNSIVVGHSIHYDFDVLHITDDDLRRINCIVRDTTTYSRFQRVRRNGSTPSLKELVKIFLHRDIQKGPHSSVVDARAALELYKRFKNDWEDEIDEEEESDSDESYSDEDYSCGPEYGGVDFYYKDYYN